MLEYLDPVEYTSCFWRSHDRIWHTENQILRYGNFGDMFDTFYEEKTKKKQFALKMTRNSFFSRCFFVCRQFPVKDTFFLTKRLIFF